MKKDKEKIKMVLLS